MKLSLEPAFKRSITYNFTDDAHIEDMIIDHGKKYEFGDITWYPSRKTAVYRYDFRVPVNLSGDGAFDFLGFQSNSILVSKSTRAAGIVYDSLIIFSFFCYQLLTHKNVKLCREIIGESKGCEWEVLIGNFFCGI